MSKQIVARLVFGLAVAFVAMQSIGCNTTKGMGEDMENAGEGIQRSAERNK